VGASSAGGLRAFGAGARIGESRAGGGVGVLVMTWAVDVEGGRWRRVGEGPARAFWRGFGRRGVSRVGCVVDLARAGRFRAFSAGLGVWRWGGFRRWGLDRRVIS